VAPVVLETERLTLREMTLEDLDFVATMLGHPEVSRYYERRFSRDDAQVWLTRQLERYARDGHGLWLVETRASGDPVGQVGLAWQEVEGLRHPEVGWLLHRPFWGHGYATEAGRAVIEAARDRWRYQYVISLIRPVNAPSRRVAERIGMTAGPLVPFHGYEHLMYRVDLVPGFRAPRPV
jgi:RimJ/RimL family protein N-acetyltransferase